MIQTQGVGRTSAVARWPRGGLTTIIRPRLIILLDSQTRSVPGSGSGSQRLGTCVVPAVHVAITR